MKKGLLIVATLTVLCSGCSSLGPLNPTGALVAQASGAQARATFAVDVVRIAEGRDAVCAELAYLAAQGRKMTAEEKRACGAVSL